MLQWIEESMKEYAEHIRNKTIDECIACVPQKMIELCVSGDEYKLYAKKQYNTCREQTITNLNKLKSNEKTN